MIYGVKRGRIGDLIRMECKYKYCIHCVLEDMGECDGENLEE